MTKYDKERLVHRLNGVISSATKNKKTHPGDDGDCMRRLLLSGKKLKLKSSDAINECAKARAISERYDWTSIPIKMVFDLPASEQKKIDAYSLESERLARVKCVLEAEKNRVFDRIILDGAGSEVIAEFEAFCEATVKSFK